MTITARPQTPTTFWHRRSTRVTALLLVFVWGAYQALWNLGGANYQTDEDVYATAAHQYLDGRYGLNLEHPPLAKYLMGVLELVFGQGIDSARILSGLCVVGGAAVTFLWLRREIGWWGALIPAGMWLLLPRGVQGDPMRIDRYALLDPTMVFFMIAGLAAGWTWVRSERWWWAAIAGALMAASVTSKVSAAVVLPVFVLLPLLWRRPRIMLVGAGAFVGAFAVVFLTVYAPVGLVRGVTFMLDFQGRHDDRGHLVNLLGTVYRYPPWWAGLAFAYLGLGLLTVVLLALGLLAAVGALIRGPWRLIVFLGSAWLLMLVFYLQISNVALATYYYPWIWFAVVLAGIGIAWLASVPNVIARVVAGLLVAAMLVPAARLSADTWTSQRVGIGRVPAFLEAHHIDGRVLVQKLSPALVHPYFGSDGSMQSGGTFDALVIGSDDRYTALQSVADLIEKNPEDFDVVHIDDVRVYLPHGEIVARGDGLVVTR
jgi:4-amino-4-deoxy-L-arabinose transferase-like glycosyltransferase